MPHYLDIHANVAGTADDIRRAHEADLAVQQQYGVDFQKYWHNHSCGKVFCLVEAPNAEAAIEVHRQSHGLVPEKIIEVDPDLVDGFLGGGRDDAGAVLLPGPKAERDTAIRSVMFTDIVGSTELAQRYGDHVSVELLDIHDSLVRAAVAEHSGRVVKHTGDGIMAVFISPVQAVRAACQIQAGVEAVVPAEGIPPFMVRIGAAVGEPIERGDDLFGCTVNLAARLCAHADPGKVLVTEGIAELCLGKGMKFAELREINVRGFDDPVGAREVMITC
jgi:class 3 adenylate cyclase